MPTEIIDQHSETTVDEAQAQLDPEVVLENLAERARSAFRRAAVGIYEAGRALMEAKARVPYGSWGTWVEENVGVSVRTADRAVRVAEMLVEHTPDFAVDRLNASTSALYALASTNTPTEARALILSEMVDGQHITLAIVNGMVQGFEHHIAQAHALSQVGDEVLALAAQHDMEAEAILALQSLAHDTELWLEVVASGCVYDVVGEPIPLHEATVRDIRNYYRQHRYEAQQQQRAEGTVVVELIGHRPMSLNRFYGRSHWRDRQNYMRDTKLLMLAALREQHGTDLQLYDVPVRISVTAYFAHHPQDASNIAVKPYEDALIGELVVDDDWQHVRSVCTSSRIDADTPRVEVRVEPYRW
jgi:hypothetical protein